MLPTITLNPNDYYYELNQKCTVVPELINYVENIQDWTGKDWHTFYLDVPTIEARQPFLKDPIIEFFLNAGWTINFTCMPPKSYYRWHIDNQGNRQTAINLALTEFESGKAIWRANRPYVRKMNSEIIDLTYKPATYYLFNTQEEHCVFNFGHSNRYLLTLTPSLRFAVPEYSEGRYTLESAARYKEILEGYKVAFKEVLGEIKEMGW